LHEIGFLLADNQDAFGFLDPTQVIQGIHLIPHFAGGHTSVLLGPSIIRNPSEGHEDWVNYYINWYESNIRHPVQNHLTNCLDLTDSFGDQDLFMRF
jgi:hypothetical protein